MKKALTVALLVVVSISLTGCLKKDNQQTGGGNEEEMFSGSFFDLVKRGKNVKCTFSDNSEDSSSEGTIYVSGSKARNDFVAKMNEGEDFESHSIVHGEYIYVWSSAGEQGTKMKLSDIEAQQEEMPTAEDMKEAYQGYKDLQDEVDFKCRPWIPDNSKFNPPSNIEFVDMGEMMQQMQEQMTQFQEDTKSMCGMCDMMPSEEEKAECKANLDCD